MTPEPSTATTRQLTAPPGYRKRIGAGFGCPVCKHKNWNAFVATERDENQPVKATFWCPSCARKFAFLRRPWVWLDCRILFIQAIAFAMLYALVMLVLGQQAPWLILSAVSAAALCALFLCAMVLRSPYSYTEKKPNPAR